MHLHIKNYKNIRNLDIELADNKVNFIYGISGSGKSSICEVLTKNELELKNNITFGVKENEQELITNPSISADDIQLFNIDNRNLFIESSNGNQIYKIIFSNDDGLSKINEKLMNHFRNISSIRPLLNKYLEDIKDLKKELGMRTNSTKIESDNNIKKLELEMNKTDFKINYNYVKKYGLEHLNWIKFGSSSEIFKLNKCPFCMRKLTEYRVEYIQKLIEFTPENYNAIVSSNTYMNIFKIEEPNYTSKRSILRVKKKIQEVLDTEKDVKRLMSLFDDYTKSSLDIENLKKEKLSPILAQNIPHLSNYIESYNNDLSEIRNKARWIKNYSNKLIIKNIDVLNRYLVLLGIPYHFMFEKYDNSKMEATVYLVHNDNTKENDNRKSLSYGETNIISILLFILSIDKKIAVIDDPASSFDENRKTVIYNLLMENVKKSTVIFLSHNQSFIKNAIINKLNNRNIDKIGNLFYLSHFNNKNYVYEIKNEDLDTIINHITNKIKKSKMSYFQKVINCRMLAEVKCKNNGKKNQIIYGYLSAILHEQTDKIDELILNKKTTEKKILQNIKQNLGVKLEKRPRYIKKGFSYNDLSLFEKVAYKREVLNKKTNVYKTLKHYAIDILSEIVHLNEENIYTLNPYLYCVYPQNVIDIIEEKII